LVISIVYFPVVVGEEDKHKVITEEEFQTKLENEDYDFSWCIFPFDVDLSDYIFGTNVNFYEARFERGANFSNATFKGDRADFTSAEFNGTANFDSAHFEEFVIFTNTVFYGNALFNNTTFFNNTIFKKYTDFTENEQGTFQGEAEFNHAIFKKEVSFLDTTFKKNATFKWATFKDRVIFQNVKFENSVYFDDTVFEDIVWFQSHGTNENTTFGKENYPDDRQCQPIASFIGTEFHKLVGFNECIFNVEADFQSAEFKGDTEFYGVVFEKELDFKRAKFEQIFTFVPTKNGEIDLRYFRCFGDGKIIADLDQTRFQGIYSIENLDFSGSDWPKDYKIYEETHIKLENEKLEAIYRDLKESFKAHGNDDYSGKFYYREMEMRKKGTSIKEFWRWSGLHFLKTTCGYGEKPFYIIIWSFVIIIGFAGLFYFTGIEIKNYLRIVHSNRRLCRIYEASSSPKEAISYFFFSLFFSITSFSTLGSNYVKSKGKWTYRLSAIESFIGALLIAIFVYLILRKLLRYF